MKAGVLALSSILLLAFVSLAGAFQQDVGQVILEPPFEATNSYNIYTSDENEPREIKITLDEQLRPYISIGPSEVFEMPAHSAQKITLTTNYTGTEKINALIHATASAIGAGGGGAVISIRLDKGVLLKPYNETVPFIPPEIIEPPEELPEDVNATPSVPTTEEPGSVEQVYETYIVIDPLVWVAAIFIFAGIVIYVYILIQKGRKNKGI